MNISNIKHNRLSENHLKVLRYISNLVATGDYYLCSDHLICYILHGNLYLSYHVKCLIGDDKVFQDTVFLIIKEKYGIG